MNEQLQDNFDNERWDKVFEILTGDNKLVSEIIAQDLAWKNFQYALDANGKDKLVSPFGKYSDLKNVISLCKQIGLVASNIPEATSLQDLDTIKSLLAKGHNIDEHSFGERTGLIVSAAINDRQLVDFFIINGAFISFDDMEHLQAIDYSTDEQIIELLKLSGGKTRAERNEEFAEYADAREKLNVLREINLAFMKAAETGDLNKIKNALKETSLDFFTLNFAYPINGKTALHLAVENNQIEVAKFLLEKGINKSSKNIDGLTALDTAKKLNRIEVIKLLDSND